MIYLKEELFKQLEKTKVGDNFFIGKNKAGHVYVKAGNIFVSSKYDPIKQANEFALGKYSQNENIVLYGLGLGYHVETLTDMLDVGQTLTILEFNLEMIKIAFENTNILTVLESENVMFIGLSDLQSASLKLKEALEMNHVSFCVYEPAIRIMPPLFIPIKEAVESFMMAASGIQIFGHVLEENKEYNIKKGYQNAGEVFCNAFIDCPLIIVAAGSSLRYNIEDLKYAQGKAKIMVLGRMAKTIEDMGIKADFYIDSDCQPFLYHRYIGLRGDVPLILLSTADKNLEQYVGEKYILHEKSGSEHVETSYTAEVGGSVATVALSFAKILGAKPVIFLGQDLCYIDEKTHYNSSSTMTKTPIGKYIEGIHGEKYYTSPNLFRFLRWIENFINKNPEMEFINATAKGAYIKGCAHMPLPFVVDAYQK